jgi:hypothetical protein
LGDTGEKGRGRKVGVVQHDASPPQPELHTSRKLSSTTAQSSRADLNPNWLRELHLVKHHPTVGQQRAELPRPLEGHPVEPGNLSKFDIPEPDVAAKDRSSEASNAVKELPA